MIDWISATVPYTHHEPIVGGTVSFFDADGAWTSTREQFALADGSFDSRCTIQTEVDDKVNRIKTALCGQHHFDHVVIGGNPAKFLQGHNLWGSSNLPELAPVFFLAVFESLGIEVDAFTLGRWMRGDYKLHRVDVTEMVDVGGEGEVRETLSSLAQRAHVAHRGRATVNHGTCSWGKRSSRRVVLKAYDKFQELNAGKKHKLPQFLPRRHELNEWARGKVRIESELHSRYLDAAGLRHGYNWHSDTAGLEWSKQLEPLSMSTNIVIHPAALKEMPKRLKKTYTAWASGYDLQAIELMSRATFYRHRTDLLAYGVDIAVPPNDVDKPRTVSLHSVIQCRIAPIPDWALSDKQLYRAA